MGHGQAFNSLCWDSEAVAKRAGLGRKAFNSLCWDSWANSALCCYFRNPAFNSLCWDSDFEVFVNGTSLIYLSIPFVGILKPTASGQVALRVSFNSLCWDSASQLACRGRS